MKVFEPATRRQVHGSLQGPVALLALRECDPERPALRVSNRSSWATVLYRQKGVDRCLEEMAKPVFLLFLRERLLQKMICLCPSCSSFLSLISDYLPFPWSG